jgi:predicted nucleic-acid-binding protein
VIGLDANLLIRYFAKDEPVQTRLAVKLIHSLSPTQQGWVGLIALAELVWVLNRTYKVKKAQIAAILATLLASKEIVIQESEMAHAALRLYLSGKADFPDCLIALSAQAAGCTRTVTFDRRAARDAGMELLA